MSGSMITIKVLRQDPGSTKKAAFQEYSLETYPGMTVLEALQKVYGQKDPTLAIQGYACYRLVCGLCSYKVNGKVVLACKTPVKDGMVIEPVSGKKVVKDLVVTDSEEAEPLA